MKKLVLVIPVALIFLLVLSGFLYFKNIIQFSEELTYTKLTFKNIPLLLAMRKNGVFENGFYDANRSTTRRVPSSINIVVNDGDYPMGKSYNANGAEIFSYNITFGDNNKSLIEIGIKPELFYDEENHDLLNYLVYSLIYQLTHEPGDLEKYNSDLNEQFSVIKKSGGYYYPLVVAE